MDDTEIAIPPVDEALPSAIDGLDAMRNQTEGAPDDLPMNLVRGRWFVRPVAELALRVDEPGAAVWLGGAVGRGWFTTAPVPVQLGADVTLRAVAPVGAASGYRFELGAAAGPWLGPVSLRLGPLARADREIWATAALEPAVSIGGAADVTLAAGFVSAVVGVTPLWSVTGTQRAETAVRGGLGVDLDKLVLTVQVADRWTAIGPIVEAGLGLQLRPFQD
ncbi:MAG: hypothetical protein ABMB14_16255 [Myxococcota bacterium]